MNYSSRTSKKVRYKLADSVSCMLLRSLHFSVATSASEGWEAVGGSRTAFSEIQLKLFNHSYMGFSELNTN